MSDKVTYNDDHLVEEVEIDIRKVDHETLSVINGGNLDPEDNYISLKRSIELLEEESFTKKE